MYYKFLNYNSSFISSIYSLWVFLSDKLRFTNHILENKSKYITIYCIRHAESVSNTHKRYNIKHLKLWNFFFGKYKEIIDPPLSNGGMKKLDMFINSGGPIIEGEKLLGQVSLLLTSNLRRSLQTSIAIAGATKNCKIYCLESLREIGFGTSDIPSMTKADIMREFPDIDVSLLSEQESKILLPESIDSVDNRIQQFFNFLKTVEKNNKVLLVSHLYFLKKLFKKWPWWYISNLGIIMAVIDLDKEKVIQLKRI